MTTPLEQKSTPEAIKQRFDNDVERFSNLQTGQTATIDAPLAMELITQAAVHTTQKIENVLDIGCGAGNNTEKLSSYSAPFHTDLVHLSPAMLAKARERGALTVGMTGRSGGAVKDLCDICIRIPSEVTARIQEAHLLVEHLVCQRLEE